jgi:alanine racemase
MTLRLRVARAEWEAHVHGVAAEYGDLLPVVKGNGYGFGFDELVTRAAALADTIAVGTVYEAARVTPDVGVVVLTPTLGDGLEGLTTGTRLTVGSVDHVAALVEHGWRGDVIVKLRSSMQRYGARREELPAVLDALAGAGCSHAGWSLHPPLDESTADRPGEASRWLESLDDGLPFHVSHLSPVELSVLRERFAPRRIVARSGTRLWLGDKSALALEARVLDVGIAEQPTAGYRARPVAVGARLVMVGVGTAHGVTEHSDGTSPFHFGRRRLELLEPPHMHTSMLVVAEGDPCPAVGDWVDVQRPLTRVSVDEIRWT